MVIPQPVLSPGLPNALQGGQKGLKIHNGGGAAPLGHHPLLSLIFLLPTWSVEQGCSQDVAKPTTVVSTPGTLGQWNQCLPPAKTCFQEPALHPPPAPRLT